VAQARDLRLRWYRGEDVERAPFVYSVAPDKPGCWLPAQPYNFKEAIEDSAKAVEGQMLSIQHQFDTFPDCDFLPYMNLFYLGEGILASVYGAIQYVIHNNPPFTEGRLFKDIYDARRLHNDIDIESTEWGAKLKEHVQRFVEATNGEIPVGSPDYQSPYGTATKLVPNEELMMAMYDAPELVHEFLDKITDGIINLLEAVERWVGPELLARNIKNPIPGECGLIIWDDYVSVLNPDMHTEFCAPYNKKLFDRFGRGHLHTCGPVFPTYINACLECRPRSLDAIILRGRGTSREDLVKFVEITSKRDILVFSLLKINEVSIFGSNTKDADDELLEIFVRGGWMPMSGGSYENGVRFKETIERIGRP